MIVSCFVQRIDFVRDFFRDALQRQQIDAPKPIVVKRF